MARKGEEVRVGKWRLLNRRSKMDESTVWRVLIRWPGRLAFLSRTEYHLLSRRFTGNEENYGEEAAEYISFADSRDGPTCSC